MQTGWLKSTVGGRKIEHLPCPSPGGAVDISAPPAGVLHTIEGRLESGIGVFRQHFAPHFTLDGQQIVQLLPLGVFACACENRAGGVETNRLARAQIEVAGHSNTKPWLPDPATTEALADLLATLEHVAGIPLRRPFPDAMPGQPWATTSFSRRNVGKWGRTAGWFGHIDLPENEHWDPGAFQWKRVLAAARAISKGGKVPAISRRSSTPRAPTKMPEWFWTWLRWRLGEGEFEPFGPHSAANRPELPFGGEGQEPIPAWAWHRAEQFVAARKKPETEKRTTKKAPA